MQKVEYRCEMETRSGGFDFCYTPTVQNANGSKIADRPVLYTCASVGCEL